MNNFLFVYGTLKRSANHSAHHLLKIKSDCVYYGHGYFNGTLYQINHHYPAATLSKEKDRVYGEVYRILCPTPLFERLDDYEECSDKHPEPHEYKRSRVSIYLNFETIVAWTYLYNFHPIGLEKIASGVYEAKRKRD